MRILRVAQKIYPDVKGGGPYHVHAISRDQAAMGHDVTVLTVGDGPRMEERDGYTVIRCPSWGSALGNDVAPGVGRHLLAADAYDVVHAHSHLYFSTNLAALARRLGETPLAITNHGLYSQTAPKWLFDHYLRMLGRWTFDSADVVFCYTDEDRERLRRFGVSTTVEVVHNGVDMDRFTPDGDAHDDVTCDGPVVLFVGRLVEGKRPGDALAAFARLRETLPDACLYICGEGPQRDALVDRAHDLGVREAMMFLGQVPYEEMPAVYRSADALVLPSRAEGLPRTVLEALATDVPVVVSDLEQVSPIVEGGGEAVSVGDVDEFGSALRAVLANPGAYDPKGTICEAFSWNDTVRKTTNVLESTTVVTDNRPE